MNRRSFIRALGLAPVAAVVPVAAAGARPQTSRWTHGVITRGMLEPSGDEFTTEQMEQTIKALETGRHNFKPAYNVWLGVDGRQRTPDGPRFIVARVRDKAPSGGISYAVSEYENLNRAKIRIECDGHRAKLIGFDAYHTNELLHACWRRGLPVVDVRMSRSFWLHRVMDLVIAQPGYGDDRLREEWSRTEVHLDKHGRGLIMKKGGPHARPIDRVMALATALHLMMIDGKTWETIEEQRRVETLGANRLLHMLGRSPTA